MTCKPILAFISFLCSGMIMSGRENVSGEIPINSMSETQLMETGFFSRYQAASLHDYIIRNGPVYSMTELSLINGFSEDIVKFLEPYIRLDSPPMWELGDTLLRQEASLRLGASTKIALHGPQDALAAELRRTFAPVAKYKLEYRQRLFVSAAISRRDPLMQNFSVAYIAPENIADPLTGKKRIRLCKAVIGDFNCRFGQGLVLWSGTSISAIPSPRYLNRSPTGISPYTGSSGTSMHGAAATVNWGPAAVSAAISFPKAWRDFSTRVYAANCSLNFSKAGAGITMYCIRDAAGAGTLDAGTLDAGLSADFRTNVAGFSIFAEAACVFPKLEETGSGPWKVSVPWKWAVVAGASGDVGDNLYLGILLRRYPVGFSACESGAFKSFSKCANEHSVTVIGEFCRNGMFYADFAHNPENRWKSSSTAVHSFQLKVKCEYTLHIGKSFVLKPILSYRLRSGGEFHRTTFQMDAILEPPGWKGWLLNSHIYSCAVSTVLQNPVPKDHIGRVVCVEPGYRGDTFSLYLSVGAYHIDHWQERIYVYRRDVSGTFNVPAMYGRGAQICFFSSARLGKHLRLSAHFSAVIPVTVPLADIPSATLAMRILLSASF